MSRPLLAGFAAAGVLAGGSPLPSQERPRFGVSADLVVLDLVAWDKDGRFVADLRPEEVEVYEDGKRQKLEFLHLAATPADRPAAPASPAETVAQPLTPTPPAPAPAPSPPASTLSLVVVVDLMTMHSEVLARTKQAIVRMARTEIEPGTRLMLATVSRGMQVRQPFNADIDRFVAAVEGGRLRVSALLPTAALAFRQAGPEYLDEIALYALLRDAAGRPVGERYLFAKTIAMKLTASRYADLRTRDNVEVPTEVDLPKPGRYSVTVVARHSGGRLASATAEIDIP